MLRSLRPSQNGNFSVPGAGQGGVSFPKPTVVDEAAYAVDVAALGEADVVRVQRRLDELERRLAEVEGLRPAARLRRELTRVARRFAR